jgi:DNA ligase-1
LREFSQLFHDLDESTKTNDRIDQLVKYLLEASPENSIWVCWFLAGNRIKGAIKTSELRTFASERSGLPEWLLEECHDRVGDLAETISLLVATEGSGEILSLSEWIIKFIEPMIGMDTEERRENIFRVWDFLGEQDFLPFHKLLTGGFRMGVSKGNLCKALARVGGVQPAIIAQRLTGNWSPKTLSLEGILNPGDDEDRLCQPFPFCLANPLQEEAENLGRLEDWQVEWKWDGIRAQLINRGGTCMIWSRGDESVGHSFPEVMNAGKWLPGDLCMDGEILAWGQDGLRSFSRLQARLGRKEPGPTILKREPVRFQAYDLLRLDGMDIRKVSLEERRKKLEAILSSLPADFPIGLSPLVEEKSWASLRKLREESRNRGVEGFMLKKKDSSFESGRVKGCWYKWKVDPYLADMVVVSAQLGHGKRSNLYSDYSLAVWDEQGELVTVAKAYSGLSDNEIEKVDRFVRKNITGKFGPVRSVKPNLVFEIAFEGVRSSGRHKSGVALRFPRINRWRTDKKIEDADTLEIIRGFTGIKEETKMADGTKVDQEGNLLLF